MDFINALLPFVVIVFFIFAWGLWAVIIQVKKITSHLLIASGNSVIWGMVGYLMSLTDARLAKWDFGQRTELALKLAGIAFIGVYILLKLQPAITAHNATFRKQLEEEKKRQQEIDEEQQRLQQK